MLDVIETTFISFFGCFLGRGALLSMFYYEVLCTMLNADKLSKSTFFVCFENETFCLDVVRASPHAM